VRQLYRSLCIFIWFRCGIMSSAVILNAYCA
jgi:hypothetical protein